VAKSQGETVPLPLSHSGMGNEQKAPDGH